jgi:purine-nucleoside phosphorylase
VTAPAVQALAARGIVGPDMGVVLGSGLGAALPALEERVEVPYAEVPGAPVPTVEGHAGSLVGGLLHGRRLLGSLGRVHLYEGATFDDVSFFVRLLGSLGTRIVVLTQAAGAASPWLGVPGVMLIRDQINLMGRSFPVRVPDGPLYSSRLRVLLRRVAAEKHIPLPEGVLAGFLGPAYETPAEVRLAKRAGADSLTMSTVPEVLAARGIGMEVIGLSVLTNRAPHSGGTIRHSAVVRHARAGAGLVRKLIEGLCACLGETGFPPAGSASAPS